MADDEKGKKDATRGYVICIEEELDLASTDTIQRLRDKYGKDEKIEVFVKRGHAVQSNPRKAAEALAEARELNGSVVVMADSALNPLGSARTETKTVTTFGE